MDMQLKLDGTLWHVETGRFPDGAVWAKVKGDLPSSASLMQIRATAMKNMDDFMLLAQLQPSGITGVALRPPGSPHAARRQLRAESVRQPA